MESGPDPPSPPLAAEQPADELPAGVPPKRRTRWLAAMVVLLLAIVAAAALGWSPLVRWLTLRQAARLGVEIELGEVEVAWEAVTLRDFGFRLHGVDGLDGTVARLTIAIDGLTPQALEAVGVDVTLEGAATDLGLSLATFAKDHPEIFALPSAAEEVSLRWRPQAGGEPWLTLQDATVRPQAQGGRLVAERVKVAGLSVGRVGASWEGDQAEVVIGLGEDDLADAPVLLLVEHASTEPKATFTLRPTPLERLAGPFALALPVSGVTASGKTVLRFSGEGPNAPIEGSLEAHFEGYRPPVPSEVKGIAFGDDTTVAAQVAITGDRRKVALRQVQVKHGAFELEGEGSMVREPDHTVVSMKLKGQLACNQLAAAAANIRVGGEVGSWLGRLAGKAVTGSVGVTVSLRADTRKLAEAAIVQQIGIGCGLRPDRLIPTVPRLPGGLPEVPKIEIELPSKGKLPKIQIGGKK